MQAAIALNIIVSIGLDAKHNKKCIPIIVSIHIINIIEVCLMLEVLNGFRDLFIGDAI